MSGTVSSSVGTVVNISAIQSICYGVIIGTIPIVAFPFVPGIVSLKFYGDSICIDTLFGSVSLNNLPEIIVASNKRKSPILLLGLDVFDRPIYKNCLHFDSTYEEILGHDAANESIETLLERILNQQPVTFFYPNEVTPSSLSLFIERLVAIRWNLKLESTKESFETANAISFDGYRNVISNALADSQFLSQSSGFNLDALAIFSLLRVRAEINYEKIFEKSSFSGRAIITSSCLMNSPMPLKISLAANSVFINSFVDVHAILIFSQSFGIRSAILLTRSVIKLRARKNDFGYFSLDRHSRDSKDALYFLLDYFLGTLSERNSDQVNVGENNLEYSLSLSASGLFEWMCRSGIDPSLARLRTNYIEVILSSIDENYGIGAI